MKVLEYGNTIRCSRCNALLEFTQEDITPHVINSNKGTLRYSTIICPICNKQIELTTVRE